MLTHVWIVVQALHIDIFQLNLNIHCYLYIAYNVAQLRLISVHSNQYRILHWEKECRDYLCHKVI